MPRTGPKSPEHRAKISAALKAYAARPDAHLHAYHVSGPEHPNWKGGIAARVYQRVAYADRERVCERCGDRQHILVHHRDGNRNNSDAANLEVLCRRCHAIVHHGKRVEWTCPACGFTLSLQPAVATRRRYCSLTCKETGRDRTGRYIKAVQPN